MIEAYLLLELKETILSINTRVVFLFLLKVSGTYLQDRITEVKRHLEELATKLPHLNFP